MARIVLAELIPHYLEAERGAQLPGSRCLFGEKRRVGKHFCLIPWQQLDGKWQSWPEIKASYVVTYAQIGRILIECIINAKANTRNLFGS